MATQHVVEIADLDSETRWPLYAAAVRSRDQPIRSVLIHPLRLSDTDFGALGLYSDKPDYFTEDINHAASILADHATIALQGAESADKARHLTIALDTSRTIGMAMGIVMRDHGVTEEQAFNLIRTRSLTTNRKLREIADDIITAGTLDTH
jgi:GAF domain-containing protein